MVSRAKDSHTTNRVVRVPDEDWTQFGEVVGERERSRVLREFIAWYLRRPKAALPKRPSAAPHYPEVTDTIVDFKTTSRATDR